MYYDQIMMKSLAIKVDHVKKTFDGCIAVNNLCFEVEQASCFGLLGPNGAGKTTMMKMLYGAAIRDMPKLGQIDIFGYDPVYNELEIKFLSGIVPQEENLDVELSVTQNLLIYTKFYGLKKRETLPRIEYLLDFMELTEKKDSKIRDLSGGMKRRLLIARALLNSPRLLILDEPTTGLDPQVRHVIWDKLRTLKKEGVTIILTTHYMEEAFQLCDSLVIMHNGEKILEGNPVSLIQSHMEAYVLEIFNMEHMNGNITDNNIRIERTENRALLYSNNLNTLEKTSRLFQAKDFYLRQSNLEDLFLRVTGRHLNE